VCSVALKLAEIMTSCNEQDDGQLGISNAKEIFYNDVPSVIADLAISELESQSRKSFESMTGYPAWANPVYNGRRSYVKTLLDKALPLGGQDYMIQRSAVDWNVGEFLTSHSPFLSQPRQLSEWILAEIARFMGDTAVTATS